MSTEVKLFAYSGLIPAPVVAGNRLSYDSVQLLKNPYLAGEVLSSPDSATADTSSTATAPAETQIALVQVQPGKRVGYEVTPGGRDARIATAASPTLQGETTIQFGPGWVLSVIELA